ncbi:MAG: hypothetical protein AB1488_08580 [Nitrospirota bacterium]
MAKPPNGKRVINTHVSEEEYKFLKEMAERYAMTLTMYLRNLVREEMRRTAGALEGVMRT